MPTQRLATGFFLAICLLAPFKTLAGQDPVTNQDGGTDERMNELEREVAELRAAYQDLLMLAQGLQARLDAAPSGVDEFYIPRQSADAERARLPEHAGGIYTKPFLTQPGAPVQIGGYIDLEFTDPAGNTGRNFDQHRLVPFLYADVSESVKFASEIEIEHGHELEVEFAQMDFLLDEHANLRAGIQLLPLGKLNEVHDSPIQDLTNRPLVDRYIIPTTLRDAGVGLWGDLGEQVSYQTTVTNGFRGLADDGTNVITATDGLREAAPQSDGIGEPFENLNDDFAYTGRVAWTPVLGVETGASGMVDKYDEAGDNDLRILALDATVHGRAVPVLPDNMELLYEGAWADVERNAFARASGVVGDMEGHYVQANVHFTPDFLAEAVEPGGLIEDGAHFTFVTRYDTVELDDYRMQRTTLGLNFRPNERHTVYKLDYLMNDDSGSAAGTNNGNAWVMSVATYF